MSDIQNGFEITPSSPSANSQKFAPPHFRKTDPLKFGKLTPLKQFSNTIIHLFQGFTEPYQTLKNLTDHKG